MKLLFVAVQHVTECQLHPCQYISNNQLMHSTAFSWRMTGKTLASERMVTQHTYAALNLFPQEQREFYALDDFYAAAEEVPLPFAGSSSSSSDGSSIAGTAAGVDEASGQGLGSGSLWSTHL
jgi:hypothetical protein